MATCTARNPEECCWWWGFRDQGAGNEIDVSERGGQEVSLGTAAQQPRGNAEASQVEQAAGRHQNMFSSLLLHSLNETTVE